MLSRVDRGERGKVIRALCALLLAAGAASTACQQSGARCTSTRDCLKDEVCVARICRQVCNSSDDCELDGEVCYDGFCAMMLDAGAHDAVTPPDLGLIPDMASGEGSASDAGFGRDGPVAEVGVDARLGDSSVPDTRQVDSSVPDTRQVDSTLPDAPRVDSAQPDVPRVDSALPDTTADSGLIPVGGPCARDSQCASGFCHPAGSICQLPTCHDGYQNQDETGVDCGGGSCQACATCWGNAANFDPSDSALDFSTAVSLSDCSPTIDTSQPPGSMLVDWCGAIPVPVVQAQPNGPNTVVVPMASLVIGPDETLRLVGDKPVVLAVRGDATILGAIDAGARGTTPGAGGDLATDGSIATAGGLVGSGDCSVFPEGTGQGGNMEPGRYSLGGGGAGFRTNGGFGGGERYNFRCYSNAPQYTLVADGYECKPLCPDYACDNSFSPTTQHYPANNGAHYQVAPIYGLAAPDLSLTPLRGGCAGGRGESIDTATAYYGGSGGGAVQLTVAGTLTVGPGGTVSAGGGGGTVIGTRGSGSGGGSGGAILLEATAVDVSAAAGIRAHGGSGGGREGGAGGCTGPAEDGHLSDDDYATHPASCVSEGRGGLSYWDVGSPACNGTGATMGSALACTLPLADWPAGTAAYPQGGTFTDNNGGGGGGGSGGIIIVRFLERSGACP